MQAFRARPDRRPPPSAVPEWLRTVLLALYRKLQDSLTRVPPVWFGWRLRAPAIVSVQLQPGRASNRTGLWRHRSRRESWPDPPEDGWRGRNPGQPGPLPPRLVQAAHAPSL